MRSKALAMLMLLVASPFAAATPYGVQVGGTTTSGDGGYYGGGTTVPVLMFSPSAMTINVGDTITFSNIGGTAAMHNVVADDGSFRCANGCDGSGGNGAPASNQWHATVTFDKAGVFHYHCETHGGQGMTGTITVNAVAATTAISGGLSGNWFDPTPGKGGHGLQLEVTPNNGLLAIWFVFNPAGTAQNWIYAQGNYTPGSNTVTIPAFLQQGGRFPPNFDSSTLTTPAWGSLTFTFTDCTNGTVKWEANATSAAAGYADVSFPIQRLTTLAGTSCQ